MKTIPTGHVCRLFALAFVLACVLAPADAPACDDGSVRDAAFEQARDMHRLCVIAHADDSSARRMADRIRAWLQSAGKDLNLELVTVAADAPDIDWTEYGIPSAPPELPVVVLAGRRTADRKSFYIDHWQPAPRAEDLTALETSPAREAIRREVGKRLAVLVYVPGNGPDAGRARAVMDRVCKARAKSGQLGVAVVRVDRHDPRERLLLSFIGAMRDGPDWVGVVFGPGKFMAPLEGDAISETQLGGLLDAVSADCTCMHSPSSLGVDIPMVWGEAERNAVVHLASRDDKPAPDQEPPVSMAAVVPALTAPIGTTAAPAGSRLVATALWCLGGLLLIAVVAAGSIAWRRRGTHGVRPTP